MRTVLHMVHKLYRLRSCNLDLSEKNIASGKYKVCLEYHIGNCKGPCVGNVAEAEHEANVDQIRQIVKGRARGVIKLLKDAMMDHAEKLEFEEAS